MLKINHLLTTLRYAFCDHYHTHRDILWGGGPTYLCTKCYLVHNVPWALPVLSYRKDERTVAIADEEKVNTNGTESLYTSDM